MSECDKMVEVREESVLLSDFVDWLREHGYAVCKRVDHEGFLYPVEYTPLMDGQFERLFGGFFGIDVDKVEQERRDLLKQIQKSV